MFCKTHRNFHLRERGYSLCPISKQNYVLEENKAFIWDIGGALRPSRKHKPLRAPGPIIKETDIFLFAYIHPRPKHPNHYRTITILISKLL